MSTRARRIGMTVAFGILFVAGSRTQAGPLDPTAFTSLGAFPSLTNTTYQIEADAGFARL